MNNVHIKCARHVGLRRPLATNHLMKNSLEVPAVSRAACVRLIYLSIAICPTFPGVIRATKKCLPRRTISHDWPRLRRYSSADTVRIEASRPLVLQLPSHPSTRRLLSLIRTLFLDVPRRTTYTISIGKEEEGERRGRCSRLWNTQLDTAWGLRQKSVIGKEGGVGCGGGGGGRGRGALGAGERERGWLGCWILDCESVVRIPVGAVTSPSYPHSHPHPPPPGLAWWIQCLNPSGETRNWTLCATGGHTLKIPWHCFWNIFGRNSANVKDSFQSWTALSCYSCCTPPGRETRLS